MDKQQFHEFITKIIVYYGKEKFYLGPNGKDRQALWFEKVSRIPGEALEWIRDHIQDDFDALPQNIPRTINHYWHNYLEANPQKKAFKKTYNCPYCYDGLIVFYESKEGYPYPIEKVVRCGYCQADDREGIGQFWYLKDIEQSGGVYKKPGDPKMQGANLKAYLQSFCERNGD